VEAKNYAIKKEKLPVKEAFSLEHQNNMWILNKYWSLSG
jgi:hypothetical protein